MDVPRVPTLHEKRTGLRIAAQRAHIDVVEIAVPDDHDVVLNSMRFHYLDWGGTGAPILFLHGSGLNAHTFDLVCLAIRKTYHCIALDQRGHGDTEWSPVLDYAPGSHARDIEAFVNYMGWDRFSLIGMSMGGLNSIVYAGRNSHRLASLVLVDVGPDLRVGGTRRIREFLDEAEALDSLDAFVANAMKFNPRRDPKILRYSLLNNLRQRPDGKWVWKWDPRPRAERARTEPSPNRYRDLWDDIARISCPTLVLRGQESEVFLDEDAQKVVDRLPRGRWKRIPGAGHTIQGDNPRAMAEALTQFLIEVSD